MPHTAVITCEFSFEAAHRLWRDDWSPEQNEAVFGNCSRLHGHSYRLQVSVRGVVDPESGMVVNFRDVKRVVRERIVQVLDHRFANDILPGLTTAENMIRWMAARLHPEFGDRLHRIEVWETRTASAYLEGEDLLAAARHG